MTGFKAMFRALWRPKFHDMNAILGLYLLVMVISLVLQGFHDGLNGMSLANAAVGSGSGFGLLVFVWLAWQMEKDHTSATYRQMPATNTSFYLAELTATAVGALYFLVVRSAIMLVSYLGFHGGNVHQLLAELFRGAHSDYSPLQLGGIATYIVVLFFLVGVLAWMLISTIHFVVTTISAFLPNVAQWLIKLVLAILLIVLIIRVMVWLFELQHTLFNGLTEQLVPIMAYSFVAVVLAAIVLGTLNVYLLKHWVEAKY
ncbi:hypothetical protein FD38_GL002411 [Levilactobacillus zymae DSM 19395]|uniref:hypothetical protein n=1 Tax=Levilactobacillus zymae TaxID=267363 RepID=UPI0006EFBB3E|nr:hypothetical protein [Levilactobacillus zymae]KRL08477.1 hypothetical protein FD38_GL002411 [Levilactobacillus zymae DSM 19395]QFR62136.1 hypothetical protein LZ395_11590 [Levilactobacillus zymae]